MRTRNAIYNVIFTWLGQVSLIFVNLVSRKIFLNLLGSEYLGVNSLFANVLSFLSMAELGIGSAITYSLYKPIAENNVEQIKSLMQLYKKAYWGIGTFILIAGLFLVPILPNIISSGENISNLNIIYFLFLINTVISYFFSYKSAFIIADQKKYIFNINHYLWQIALYVVQILVLILSKNYYIYLITQITITLLENITIVKITDKHYPFLKNQNVKPLDKDVLYEIKKNTYSMVLNKVGSTLVNSTDNILISTFVGLSAVGIYGNYSTISAAIGSFLYQGMYAVVASVGNLSVLGSKERKCEIFEFLYIIVMWLYGWACIGQYVLLTPFVQLWYGTNSILSSTIVVMIVINMFIAGQTVLLRIHIDAMGLYWHVRYNGIIEAAINLVTSIYLGKKFGLVGVLVGTAISHVTYTFWKESITVFRFGLNSSPKRYYSNLMKDMVTTIAVLIFTSWLANKIPLTGGASFLMKLLMALTIPNIAFYFYYKKRPAFGELSNLVKKIILVFLKKQKV